MRANKTRAGLLVCLCFLLILGSCKEEEDAVLNLSMSEITFGSKSEVKSVEVYANTSWSAEIVPSASSSWISLNVVSGKSGTSAIQITLTENDTPDERTAEIIFRGSSTSQTLKVTQEKNERIVVRFDLYKHRRKLQWASPNRQCLCKRKRFFFSRYAKDLPISVRT